MFSRGDIITPTEGDYERGWVFARSRTRKKWSPLVEKGIYLVLEDDLGNEDICVMTPEGDISTVPSYTFRKL